jgi:hypothetical protein
MYRKYHAGRGYDADGLRTRSIDITMVAMPLAILTIMFSPPDGSASTTAMSLSARTEA